MNDEEKTDTGLLKFPCDFTLKIFGKSGDEFEKAVYTIVKAHFPNLKEGSLKQRASQQHNYLALAVTVHAESQKQLDDLYRELSSNAHVIMVL